MGNHTFSEWTTPLKTVNVTQASTDFISWLHTGRGAVVQVEVLMMLTVLLHAVQVVCGWWRRCSSNSVIKYSLWLAYTANPSLVVYTLSLLKASPLKSSILSIFAVTSAMALGGTNFMTAYSIDDNKQYTRHFVQQCLYVLSFVSITRISLWNNVGVFFLVSCLMISVNPGRIYASMTASSFMDRQTSSVVEHMEMESAHAKPTSYYNPVTLEGYEYLVHEEIGSPTEITVSRIWACLDDGPFGSGGSRLKEVCLSFALFRLLRRRFFGIACPESKLQKTRDFVMEGLLSGLQSNATPDCDAAYRVIAAELAFAHDHFFTSSASFGCGLGTSIIILGLVKLPFYLALCIGFVQGFVQTRPDNKTSSLSTQIALTTVSDIIVVAVIMLVLSSLEVLQVYLYVSSDWAKVQLVRRFISGKYIPSGLFHKVYELGFIFGYWQNKVGQHSLLKDLHRRSFISDVIGSLSACFYGVLFSYHSALSRGICHPGIKGPDHIELTGDVKLAVARALKVSNGQLSNGAFSLRRNAQRGLLWACQQENHISTMLIWHVATEYCDIIAHSCRKEEEIRGSDSNNRKIACTLSSYSAYLMAYVPELLPGHELGTRKLFDNVRRDALDMLSGGRELSEKYRILKGFVVQESDERIVMKGIRLGKQLEEIGDVVRWNTLADFWTEMILYIAPSDNAKAHFEHLANGGEFLTHLWALLFHAGIVERGKLNLDVENVYPNEEISIRNAENNRTHQETETLQTRSTGLQKERMQHSVNNEIHQVRNEYPASNEFCGANRDQRTVHDIENAGDVGFQRSRSYPMTSAEKRGAATKLSANGNNVDMSEISVVDGRIYTGTQVYGSD